MNNNYTIAVCDILGFSKLVETTQPDRVVTNTLGWIRKALYHSIHEDNPKNVPNITELNRHTQIGFAWFSDTILLYTREDTTECIRTLIRTVSWFMFDTMLNHNTRIRCGVSYGQAVIEPENDIYVGKPIIEALNLEKIQLWSGGALTSEAVQRIPADAREGQNIYWWLVPYEVPTKEGNPFKTLAIDWTQGIHNPKDFFPWSKTKEKPTELDWMTRRDICEKWFNTKKFHDEVCDYCGNSK